MLRGIPMISKEEWQYWKALNAFRYGAICHGVYARGLQSRNAGSTTAVIDGCPFSIELGLVCWMRLIRGCDLNFFYLYTHCNYSKSHTQQLLQISRCFDTQIKISL